MKNALVLACSKITATITITITSSFKCAAIVSNVEGINQQNHKSSNIQQHQSPQSSSLPFLPTRNTHTFYTNSISHHNNINETKKSIWLFSPPQKTQLFVFNFAEPLPPHSCFSLKYLLVPIHIPYTISFSRHLKTIIICVCFFVV